MSHVKEKETRLVGVCLVCTDTNNTKPAREKADFQKLSHFHDFKMMIKAILLICFIGQCLPLPYDYYGASNPDYHHEDHEDREYHHYEDREYHQYEDQEYHHYEHQEDCHCENREYHHYEDQEYQY